MSDPTTAGVANAGATPAAIGDRLREVRWLLGSADELKDLMELFEQFRTATTLRDRWSAIKSMGDVVVGLVESRPMEISALEVVDEAAIRSLATAKSFNFEKVLELATTLLPLLLDLATKLKG